jgi:hypothetical protein
MGPRAPLRNRLRYGAARRVCRAENPYTRFQGREVKDREVPEPGDMKPMLEEAEKDYQGSTWYFKTGSLRVALGLRIPYCFTDKSGQEIKEYLLTGFEGSGGF